VRAAPAAAPQRPPRDPRLDALRGVMQMQIFISHVGASWFAAWAIHAAWGLSDSSEQFVLLSGLGLGSLFALKAARDGASVARADLRARTLRLWRMHLVVFFLFGGLVIWADRAMKLPGEIERLGWGWMAGSPLAAALAAPTLLYQPAFMDILPVFLWCMLALPAFMALLARSEAAALSLSLLLYAAAQWGGLALPGLGGQEIGFNPFAWQVLFAIGAWAGRRALLHGRVLPPSPWLTLGAAAILLAGVWIRLGWHGLLPEALMLPVAETDAVFGKQDLALPRLLHALSVAVVVARVTAREGVFARPALAPLRAAGRHSLEVFCLGLFLSWGASHALERGAGSFGVDVTAIVAGMATLLAFAWWKERGAARGAASGVASGVASGAASVAASGAARPVTAPRARN
jgi:hypothetical protein